MRSAANRIHKLHDKEEKTEILHVVEPRGVELQQELAERQEKSF